MFLKRPYFRDCTKVIPDPKLISPRFYRLRVRLRLTRSPALRFSKGRNQP